MLPSMAMAAKNLQVLADPSGLQFAGASDSRVIDLLGFRVQRHFYSQSNSNVDKDAAGPQKGCE